MKTIKVTVDEPLLDRVDQLSQDLGKSRSAFIREVLEEAIRGHEVGRLEQQHAEGYASRPVEPGEFDIWENEQTWSDE